MWLEPLSHLLVALALVGQTPAATPAALPDLITTQQPVFAIPFRLERTEDSMHQVAEVQLLVSTDRGRRWQLYAKSPPTQQHFLFRAGGDSEYWFAIRTIDRSGQVRPETISGPGLRVMVAAKKPTAGPEIPNNQTAAQPPDKKPSQHSPRPGTDPKGWSAGERPGATAAVSSNSPRPLAGEGPGVRAAGPETASKPTPDLAPKSTTDLNGSVAIAISSAFGTKYGSNAGSRTAGEAFTGLPPGEHPRMVNSLSFQLEYDVDSVGPSGIGRVELWGTRDGGKSWRQFQAGNNGRNTLVVSVPQEGLYGFRVVVTNGAGLGGRKPVGGDLPDLWVGVDLTKPTARIISTQQGVDVEAGHLIISWQADDQMLAARPVSLSFSSNRTGPWLPIASGLENTGRYAWSLDNRTPAKCYLRIEVRDEAGNVSVHEMSDPIAIDQSRPTIRVRDVRPVGQTSARPSQSL
jgi:hypothetical protein